MEPPRGSGQKWNRPISPLCAATSALRSSSTTGAVRPRSMCTLADPRSRPVTPRRGGKPLVWSSCGPDDRNGPVRATLREPLAQMRALMPAGATASADQAHLYPALKTAVVPSSPQRSPSGRAFPTSPHRSPSGAQLHASAMHPSRSSGGVQHGPGAQPSSKGCSGDPRAAPALNSAGQLLTFTSHPAGADTSPRRPAGHTGCAADDEDVALQGAICESLELAEPGGALAAKQAERDEAYQEAISQSLEEVVVQNGDADAKQPSGVDDISEADRQASKRRRPLPPAKDLARTFGPMQWLNDASIAFVYALITAGIMKTHDGTGLTAMDVDGGVCEEDEALPERVLLIEPATAFWLTIENDPGHFEDARKALKLDRRSLVLCPINDNRNGSQADAGTHWSLLVCCSHPRESGFKFMYYDSFSVRATGSRNLTQARTLAGRLAGKSTEVAIGSVRAADEQF